MQVTSASEVQDTLRPYRVAVLCDFDSTITQYDAVEALYEEFAGPPCAELSRRWQRGEISTMDEMRGCFATMTASRSDMEARLSDLSIDASFPSFLGFCEDRGYDFAVVSDGLDWIIEMVLEQCGLSGLTVYSNGIRFTPEGPRLLFPHFDPEAPLRGVSKPSIIKRYQSRGYRVVFVGDGPSDLEALPFADLVYAKGRLLAYCRERGHDVVAFVDFDDLMRKWVAVG